MSIKLVVRPGLCSFHTWPPMRLESLEHRQRSRIIWLVISRHCMPQTHANPALPELGQGLSREALLSWRMSIGQTKYVPLGSQCSGSGACLETSVHCLLASYIWMGLSALDLDFFQTSNHGSGSQCRFHGVARQYGTLAASSIEYFSRDFHI